MSSIWYGICGLRYVYGIQEAIPVMERRVKRIVRQVGRTTEDGYVSVERLSSLKVGTVAWGTVESIVGSRKVGGRQCGNRR